MLKPDRPLPDFDKGQTPHPPLASVTHCVKARPQRSLPFFQNNSRQFDCCIMDCARQLWVCRTYPANQTWRCLSQPEGEFSLFVPDRKAVSRSPEVDCSRRIAETQDRGRPALQRVFGHASKNSPGHVCT